MDDNGISNVEDLLTTEQGTDGASPWTEASNVDVTVEDLPEQAAEHLLSEASDGRLATIHLGSIHLGSREIVDPRLAGDNPLDLPVSERWRLLPEIDTARTTLDLSGDGGALAGAGAGGAGGDAAGGEITANEADAGTGLGGTGHLSGLGDEAALGGLGDGAGSDETHLAGLGSEGGTDAVSPNDAMDESLPFLSAAAAPRAAGPDVTAEAAAATANNVAGSEDTVIALDLSAALTDTDGSETLAVAIEGVPAGAALSAGADEGGGRWALDPADLAGLTMTPPADLSGTITLDLIATTTETLGGATTDVTRSFDVSLAGVADTPTLGVADTGGNEDAAIALTINPALTDTDGSETLAVTVSGVPAGATLSAGTNQGGGVWELAPGDLAGLTLTPPADSDADFTLTVTATATDGIDVATTIDTIDVAVAAVADTPTLTANDVTGAEDTGIALNLAPSLADIDGSETLTVTVAGVPAGATLSAGADQGGGTWTLTQGELAGLTLTPPADSDADIALTVTATATDGADTASTVDTMTVTVTPAADAPTLAVVDAAGNEDSAIALTINPALTDTDGSETLAVTVAGVPLGATLSAGTDTGGGVWTLTPAELAGLTVTPPADSHQDFTLTVTATATDGSDTATTVDTIDVDVTGVADTPNLTVATNVAVTEDNAIGLTINPQLTDTDGSETLAVTIDGVPAGATLSAGSDQGGGTWTLTPAQLAGLQITPPADSDADFALTVTATSTDNGGDTATAVDTINVTVNPDADAPNLTVTGNVTGNEDTAIPLTIASSLTDTDGSESLAITVAGVPAGATLSAGADQGGGVWTLTPAQLAGLTVTPASDSDADFALTVTATATDGGDSATTVDTINVTVDPVADQPTLGVADANGAVDTAIPLTITPALTDTDGSETLAVTISGVPAGATLSAGTDTGGGVWTLTPAQLAGLTFTSAPGDASDFTLTVTAVSTDGADTAQLADTIDVTVTNAPSLGVSDTTGDEDNNQNLSITTDGDSVTIAGVPTGATLSAGTDTGGGVWTLTPAQLAGLQITPPADSDADFTLTVTSTNADGSTVDTIDVTVDAVADDPTLTANNVSGDEDAAIALNITSALQDTDGSETLAVTISGVPAGATLSAGADQGGGVWHLTGADLAGLTVTPPADASNNFLLNIEATATEGANADTATVFDSMLVQIDAVGDGPAITTDDTNIEGQAEWQINSYTAGNQTEPYLTGLANGTFVMIWESDGQDGSGAGVYGQLYNQYGMAIGGEFQVNTYTTQDQRHVSTTKLNGGGFVVTWESHGQDGSQTGIYAQRFDDNASPVGGEFLVNTTTNQKQQNPSVTNLDDGGFVVVWEHGQGNSLDVMGQRYDANGNAVGGEFVANTNTAGKQEDAYVAGLTGGGFVVIYEDRDGADGDGSGIYAQRFDANGNAVGGEFAVNTTGAGNQDVTSAVALEGGGFVATWESQGAGGDGSGTAIYGQAYDANGNPQGAEFQVNTTTTNDQENGHITALSDGGFFIVWESYGQDTSQDGVFGQRFDANGVKVGGEMQLNDTVSGNQTAPQVATLPNGGMIVVWQDETGLDGSQIGIFGKYYEPAPLDISAALQDTDGSETLGNITVSGIPAGMQLSAGTDLGGGAWELTPAELPGLSISPPITIDYDFTLTITGTSTEISNGDVGTTVTTLDVRFTGLADTPILSANDVTGNEDTAIALDITAALTDTDGSETLAVTISNVPAGATFSAGTDLGGGNWEFTEAEIVGLTFTPPADSDADYTLTVTATSTETATGDIAQDVVDMNVTVNPVADAPNLTANDVTGNEDTAIAVDITTSLNDTDGSETLGVTISGVPAGATLSAGTDQGGGVWHLTGAQVAGLTITPPANSDADFTLTVTSTATDGADTATTVDTFDVTVDAVADAPNVLAVDQTGAEDTAIALNLNANLVDTDGSETLTVTVAGVPAGATLSAGANQGGGVWHLTAAEVPGLSITPPTDDTTDINLTITATATEASNGDTTTAVDTMTITVTGQADAPNLSVVDPTSGNEDTAIALTINPTLTDPSETLGLVTISGAPAGAILSAGTDMGGGTWTVAPGDLAGLTITPPGHSGDDFMLTIRAVSIDGADTASTVDTITVSLTPVADAPTLSVTDASGLQDTAIDLTISSGLIDLDGSESLAITVSGVPAGATLSAGTDQGGGSWLLTPAQLGGLQVTPPPGDDTDFTLTVTANATETENLDTATAVDTIDVAVAAGVGLPTLVVSDKTVLEDGTIALDINSTTTDAGDVLTVTISGVPAGATLSAGTDTGGGVWELTEAQLAGLTLTPPNDDDTDFTLNIQATARDGASEISNFGSIDMTVTADADAPSLAVNGNVTGDEDSAIALTINAGLADTDGSETLSAITVSGVPAGATLSAGTDTGGGVWTLTPAQLVGLTITPPSDSDADFSLNVSVTSTEAANGDTATSNQTINVTVDGVADTPNLSATNNVTGNEDTAIPLTIASSLTDTDGSESLAITISGVPAGASLSAGTDTGGGVWTLTPAQLAGLSITPPGHSDGDFTLTVTAVSTDDGDTANSVELINVTVDAVADAPNLTVTNDVTGNEDSAIALTISPSLIDVDGSETLAVTVSGVPAGATLSAGTDMGGGTWTLTPAQLGGLTVTPPGHSDVDFTLTVTATATDTGGDTATTVDTINVTVDAVADAPNLTANDVTGNEDTAIALNLTSSLNDTDGSETLAVTVDGVPAGATLSAGTDQGGGTWTLTPAQLAGLTLTPPAHSDADINLTVTATATDTGGVTETTVDTMTVTVDAVADAPNLTVTKDVTGNEDRAELVDVAQATLDAAVAGTTVTVTGVPAGASLSSGTDQGGGTWVLNGENLGDLMITPPSGSGVDIPLNVVVTQPNSTLVNATFDADAEGFTYSDDTFRATSQPGYATGSYDGAGGQTGGGLRVDVGGVDGNSITNMSGGHEITFNVPSDATGTLTFSYRMVMDAGYESDEYGEVLASIDGTLVGTGGNDYVHQAYGDGNGGADYDTGWQTVVIDLGSLTAGNHTLALGGFNNKKTVSDEDMQIWLDDVSVTVDSTELANENVTVDIEAGIPLTIASSLVDTDGSETLAITIDGVPAGATLSAGTDQGGGTWTLTPAQLTGLTIDPPAGSDTDFTLTVTATATDTGGVTATTVETIDVKLDPVNDAPVAQAAEGELEENGSLTGQLSATDVDDAASALTYTLATQATNGTVSISADGNYTYTPNAHYVGADSFTFTVTDAEGATSTQTVTLDVQAVPRVPDVSTGSEFQVNSYTSGNQDDPRVAALSGGGFVVTWESFDQDGQDDGIYAQRYDSAGNAVGGEFLVNTTTSSDQMDVDIVGLDGGGFVVTWTSDTGDGSSDGVFAQRYDANGNTQGGEFQVNTTTSSNQADPAIAALDDGGFVIAYRSDVGDGSSDAILAQRYDANGNAVGSEFLVNSYTSNNQKLPSAVGLEGGGFVIVWTSDEGDGSSDVVFGQRYDSNGNTVGGEFQVNTTTSSNQTNPSVAALVGGGFVVVFQSDVGDGSSDAILAQRYDANGNAVGGELVVNTTTSDNQQFPRVTALEDGGFMVVWDSANQDGDSDGVYAQKFDASGNKVDGETLVNSTTSGSQDTPAIVTQADGSVVVVWESQNLDGSGDAIAARVFSAVDSPTDHTMTGAAGDDALSGGGGIDTISGAAGDDIISGGLGADVLDGGAGTDTLSYAGSGAGVNVNLGTGATSSTGVGDTFAAAVNGHNPVAYLRLGESSGTVANDETGTHDGIWQNNTGIGDNPSTPFSGITTTATAFDGGDDYVEIPASTDFQLTEGSITMWFMVDDVTAGTQTLVSRDSSGFDGGGHLDISVSSSGQIDVRHQSSSQSYYADSGGTTVSSGTWYMLTYTFGSNGMKIFLDGTEVGSNAYTGGIDGNNEPWVIGASQQSSGDGVADSVDTFLDGSIAEFAVYDTQLAEADVDNLIDAGVYGTDQSDATGDTISNFENVIGSGNDDSLTGDANANVIEGGAGADTIDGAGGEDTASYAGSSLAVSVDLDAGTATGGDATGDTLSNIENLLGSAYDDTLTGTNAANVLNGGLGNDTLNGLAGDDTLFGGAGNDQLNGGTGADTLHGDAGNDTLNGGADNDTLYGGTGNDTLNGDAGNDMFFGGEGDDIMTGGDGSDTFIFANGDGNDTAHGGAAGGWTDTIQMQNVTGDYLTGDWTLNITSGSIQSTDGNSLTLSQDAEGTITTSDGSQLTFDGVEQIQW